MDESTDAMQENSDCSSPEWVEKASWATLHLLDGHSEERPSSRPGIRGRTVFMTQLSPSIFRCHLNTLFGEILTRRTQCIRFLRECATQIYTLLIYFFCSNYTWHTDRRTDALIAELTCDKNTAHLLAKEIIPNKLWYFLQVCTVNLTMTNWPLNHYC